MVGIKIKIWPEKYSILKVKKLKPPITISGFSSLTNALNELSLVCPTNQIPKIPKESILERNDGWRLITFVAKLDFGMVGFMSKVSTALAKEGISIFVISTFDTDHLLVKQKNLEKTKKVLENLRT